MKALFVHDHKFKYDSEGTYYTSGSLSAKLWQRYLNVFDSLTVVGRDNGKLSSDDNKHAVSSTCNVNFNLLPDLSNLKSELLGNKVAQQECVRLLEEHDVLIARVPSRLGNLFIKEAIKQRKPYAVEVVGNSWDALWNYGGVKGKLYAPLMELKTKKAVYNANYALYVTNNFLQKRYPTKGVSRSCSDVVISPVDKVVLEQRIDKINQSSNKLVLGLIGNYSANYKGIDVAIKALAEAQSKLNTLSLELQIVGSGNSQRYTKLIEDLKLTDQVKFMGRLPSGNAVFEWLDTVDIYLQPSLVEGLPRALIEAMSRGCPSLGSNAGGIPELLNKQQISQKGSSTKLAKNIINLANNTNLLNKLARQNFDKTSHYYDFHLNSQRNRFWKDFANFVLSKSVRKK